LIASGVEIGAFPGIPSTKAFRQLQRLTRFVLTFDEGSEKSCGSMVFSFVVVKLVVLKDEPAVLFRCTCVIVASFGCV